MNSLDLKYYFDRKCINWIALNVTAMFCPGDLSRRTAKTANGAGLFGPITGRQTNIEIFNIEVQHTREFYLQKINSLVYNSRS